MHNLEGLNLVFYGFVVGFIAGAVIHLIVRGIADLFRKVRNVR